MKRSIKFNLKEINPEYSLEGWMLKLRLQYFGHLMRRADSFEKSLMLGKIEGRRRRDDWMASPTLWTWVWVSSGNWWWTGKVVCYSPWGFKDSYTTEWLNWLYTTFKVIVQKYVTWIFMTNAPIFQLGILSAQMYRCLVASVMANSLGPYGL